MNRQFFKETQRSSVVRRLALALLVVNILLPTSLADEQGAGDQQGEETAEEHGLRARFLSAIKGEIRGILSDAGWNVDWKKIRFSTKVLDFSTYVLTLGADGLEVASEDQTATLAFQDLRLSLTMSWSFLDFSFEVKKVEPLSIQGVRAYVQLPPSGDARDETPLLPNVAEIPVNFALPKFAENMQLQGMNLHVDSLVLGPARGDDGRFQEVVFENMRLIISPVNFSTEDPQKVLDVEWEGSFHRSSVKKEGGLAVKAQGELQLPFHLSREPDQLPIIALEHFTLRNSFDALTDSLRIGGEIDVEGNIKARRFQLRLDTRIPSSKISGLVESRHTCEIDLRIPSPRLWKLQSSCGLQQNLQRLLAVLASPELAQAAGEAGLKPLYESFFDFQESSEKNTLAHAKSAELRIENTLLISNAEKPHPLLDVQTRIHIPALDFPAHLVQPEMHARVAFSGSTDELSGNVLQKLGNRAEGDFRIQLPIADVSDWIQLLKSTPWAVPASANSLGGSVTIDVSGKWSQNNELQTELQLITRLDGPHQQLHTTTKASSTLNSSSLIEGRLECLSPILVSTSLEKMQVQIPTLSWAQAPQMGTDTRFLPGPAFLKRTSHQETGPVAARKIGLPDFQLQMSSASSSPVRIRTNLTEEPLRLDVQMALKQEKGEISQKAEIRFYPFSLELFRRRAEVEMLSFSSRSDEEIADLNGKVSISYAAHEVQINLSGTIGHPVLQLKSEPPLPEDSIYSVLLFGKPLDFASPGEESSAAAAREAIASGAISILSLYYLASTPVDSLSYDPSNGALTADFRLGEKTSFSLGATLHGEPVVGLQRRIFQNVYLNTQVLEDSRSGLLTRSYLEFQLAFDTAPAQTISEPACSPTTCEPDVAPLP